MRTLVYNPNLTRATIRYVSITDPAIVIDRKGPPSSVWPSLDEFWLNRKKTVRVVKSTYSYVTNDYFSEEFVCKVQPGDIIPAQPKPVTLNIPSIKVNNRGWRRRKARGEVVMSPYRVGTAEYQRRVCMSQPLPNSTGMTSVYKEFGWYEYDTITGAGVPPGPPPAPVGYRLLYARYILAFSVVTHPADTVVLSPDLLSVDFSKLSVPVDEGLVTRVLADCNNGVFDLLTEVLELPQTVRFLGEQVKLAVGMTCDLEDEARRMRKHMPAAKFAKWLSGHWLKGRYALMPIFYSIADIAKVLDQIGREYESFRGWTEINQPFPFELSPDLKCSDTPQVRHRCQIKTRYTTDSLLHDLKRLCTVNLASSAWELTTLSFVADWAFNIGDYIAALTGSSGASEMKCCYTFRNTESYHIHYNSDLPKLKDVYTPIKFNLYDRNIINPSAHIGLQYELDMTWLRIIDSFALLTDPSIKRIRALRG